MTQSLTTTEAAALLRERDHFLILTHRRPDGDTVGSAAALCLGLRALGKRAYVLSNPDLTEKYAIYFSGLTAPERYFPQCIVSVDVASSTMFSKNAEGYASRVDLVLDHHPGNDIPASFSCILPELGAVGELICGLLEILKVPLTGEIALPIYVAVSTDTGCFAYANTTANSHRVAMACLSAGVQAGEVNRVLFSTKSRGRIAMEGILLNTMEYYHEGRVALCCVKLADAMMTGVTSDDLDNVASLPRSVEGVEVGLMIKETREGCKISVRTGEADASRICRRLGGGGHVRASGAFVAAPLEEAKRLLLAAVDEELL